MDDIKLWHICYGTMWSICCISWQTVNAVVVVCCCINIIAVHQTSNISTWYWKTHLLVLCIKNFPSRHFTFFPSVFLHTQLLVYCSTECHQLLLALKSTVERLLAMPSSNVWNVHGGLERLSNSVRSILVHRSKPHHVCFMSFFILQWSIVMLM